MRIPKRFKILGHTIEVVENKRLVHDRNWNGMASYEECKIELSPISEYNPKAITKLEQIFCHELSHYLIYYAGCAINHKLGDDFAHENEEFVDLLGSLIHQVFTTMEYE